METANESPAMLELADGRIGYVLKKRWRDGTTHVVMTKQVLTERLRRQRWCRARGGIW